MLKIKHLYISPDHNYFGHHGKPAGEYPAIEVDAVECVANKGIKGDRFFDYKEDYKGQITFFSYEVYKEVCKELGVSDKQPSVFRRNVIIEGADLNALIDKDFEVQGVQFHGMQECSPCYWMDQALAPGTEALLKGRGGLRCKILTSGTLRRET